MRLLLAWSLLSLTLASQAAPPRAAVFSDHLPDFDRALATNLTAQVQAAGYGAEFIDTATLTNQALLSSARFDLLVLPGARTLPLVSAPAIVSYLKSGGALLALGLPAWDSPVFQLNGQWVSRQTYDQTLAATKPQHTVENFARADLSRWQRVVGDATGKGHYELVDTPNGKALHVVIEHLGGWDTLASPALTAPFPAGHTLTCFRAKGGGRTRQLALEWRQTDGSRWIATLDLTPEWKSYVLTPDLFKAWPIWPPDQKPKGHFQPQKAASFTVGLAMSHTALEGERQEYWFADLGTAANPFGESTLPEQPDVPTLESLAPSYQCFPITTPFVVKADHQKVGLEPWETTGQPTASEGRARRPRRAANAPGPSSLADIFDTQRRDVDSAPYLGLQPRARGVGFNQGRPWRWEPLLGAYDATNDDYRGALAALLVHLEPPFRGSIWAVFTPTDAAFYQRPVVTNCLQQVLARMKRGVFLAEGGTEFFTVFAGQPFKTGASVVNFGHEAVSNLALSVQFLNAKGAPQRAVLEGRFRLAPGETKVLEQDGLARSADEVEVSTRLTMTTAPNPAPVPAQVVGRSVPERRERPRGELGAGLPPHDGGPGRTALPAQVSVQCIDALAHEFGVWQSKAKPQFIEAKHGAFYLNGKPWKAHGVNYMPSSGIGLTRYHLFEQWLGRGAYDPAVVDRDLRRIRGMGLNAVSIFIDHQSLDAQHLLDILRRCDALGLHANLALRPGDPMHFQWPLIQELIQFYRLAENDTVFAYDLAWEPSHGGYQSQQHAYAKAWNAWVLQRYGTLAAATAAWGVPAPTRPGTADLDVPSMTQLTSPGPWRKLVADYRLFLDGQLREHYDAARKLVKSTDPHHAVSFRMANTGDPSYNWDNALPYDFYGLAGAVDIWAPEAYGRIGDWDKVKAGAFTAAYARLCDPTKPLMWAEMGYSVWDINRMAPDPHKLEFEAHYFADFYRMMRDSGANGIFYWWYPGGFRVGENSDYGILNPDGTDRPVTKVIRSQGPRFLQAPPPPQPDYWLTVDRDADPRGLHGIYEAAQKEFWQAVANGHHPGLKWKQAPGAATNR